MKPGLKPDDIDSPSQKKSTRDWASMLEKEMRRLKRPYPYVPHKRYIALDEMDSGPGPVSVVFISDDGYRGKGIPSLHDPKGEVDDPGDDQSDDASSDGAVKAVSMRPAGVRPSIVTLPDQLP